MKTFEETVGKRLNPSEIESLCEKLWAPKDKSLQISNKAYEILKQAYDISPDKIVGKSPSGLIVGAVYIAGVLNATDLSDKRTQGEISRASGITEVTIRNRYKHLAAILGITGVGS